MLKLSLIDPPGWIIDLIPFLWAISTQSGNGKKASLAIEAPLRSNPNFSAFSMAWFKASTLLVWPVPLASNCLFLTNTMVLDFVFLEIFDANNKSSIWFLFGWILVG